ncbi:hypothetical protein TrLO_g7376 [Triparma laevis f. longispina]|uniref:MYND-type domain-containing protein n=1 Tax=Triparma laevis f. longispina TaxID=1714387 RepID=A0A9W6ZWS3_9STRA|nr:hypothetical protein TrLO_g7376 [Triparma laevis f. longispina]
MRLTAEETHYCSKEHQTAHWKRHKKLYVAPQKKISAPVPPPPPSPTVPPRTFEKLEILNACFELGRACCFVDDFDDARRYLKRAKEGYEEQLGRDSEKLLEATCGLIAVTPGSDDEKFETYRDLLKRVERALGEENVVTFNALTQLGMTLSDNGEYEEAKEVYERYLAGSMKVLGEDHKDTLSTLNNLGTVYDDLKIYEKAMGYYVKALKGY